jgi:hypothetical protein
MPPFGSQPGVCCKTLHVEEETVTGQTILWRRLDKPGHEASRFFLHDSFRHLVGTAVFAHNAHPCRLDYAVVCNAEWQTVSATVQGWVGDQTIAIGVSADATRRWWLNGAECSIVAGSIDLDLNFSPSTNLLPIRRLDLAIGQEAQVQAAWLRFPSFALEPLDQRYRRLDAATYRYESGGGAFATELQVNEAGFITLYPNFFQVEPGN